MNVNHCEACTAMLEPVEMEQSLTQESDVRESESALREDSVIIKAEKLEDVRIDSLKADIESKFVSTLLQEIGQLRKRLSRKEKSLSELKDKESRMGHYDFLLAVEQREKEIEEIIARTAKLESILENLKKKIEGDVSDLEARITETGKPVPLWFLNKNSRYHRMLSSELKTKNRLMDVLLGKRSAGYFRLIKLRKTASLATFLIAISLASSWYFFIYGHKTRETPPPSSLKMNLAGEYTISEKDIIDLLADIRMANIKKDLGLWESRYSKDYSELQEKKRGLIKQWERFNFRDLRYNVSNVEIGQGRASAVVTWKMELLSKNRKEMKIFPQRLHADFIVEEGRLKIISVRKE